MYMIEITEGKVESLYEHLEKGIKYIGKAMNCIEELKSEHYGEREHRDEDYEDYGERGGMGYRIGSRRGRYSRY